MSAINGSGGASWPLIKKQRHHQEADFDNVKDEISHEELQGISESDRAQRIVAWANWWFRSEKFCPQDESLAKAWKDAINNAVPMLVEDWRVVEDGRPRLTPTEEQNIQRIKQSLVPVVTRPFQDSGAIIPPGYRTDAKDFIDGYRHYQRKWLDSAQQLGLERILQTTDIPFVNKIVAFGTGSPAWTRPALLEDLDPNDFGPNYRIREIHRQRFTQYAILMWMAVFFGNKHGLQVEVYVQDPDLKATDEEALEQLGFIIMDGEYDYQEGFTMIDDNTLVYDAIISSKIYQIYMQYAYPAAVMTTQLDLRGFASELQDEHKYVVLQHPNIENGVSFPWPQPLYPNCATNETISRLRNCYDGVPLLDAEKLHQERWRENMPYAEFHEQLMDQVERETRDYHRRTREELNTERARLMAERRFDEAAYKTWAARYRAWKESVNPPPLLHDMNFSAQHELALYVRKRPVVIDTTSIPAALEYQLE